jgi:UDP-GlcNAc:undecaprenyl-phosphate GlcNAc-1-phosphate transferase
MLSTLFEIALITLLVGIPIQFLNLKLARKFKWVDIPTLRKKHLHAVPITGGVGVLITWVLGLACFSMTNPSWFQQNNHSLAILLISCGILVVLGLVDDLRGLSPGWKLAVESIIAVAVVSSVPEVNDICTIWSHKIGLIVWPLAVIWIVGITNAINLIDGLDGLAGGTSALVLAAIAFLCLLVRDQTLLPIVLVVLLLPALLIFLGLNWAPAKIFLGDNGSLPIGFVISVASLMCRPHVTSWIMIASMVLMLGYPLVDTGLAVLRRYSKGQPLFKADRNHLHYRIQRLGLNTSQTTVLLLSLSLYLQFTGICVNFLQPWQAGLVICIATVSIVTLLQLVYSIEKGRVVRLFHNLQSRADNKNPQNLAVSRTVVHLELGTLLETAHETQSAPYKQVVEALELLLGTMVRKEDSIYLNDQKLSIVLDDHLNPEEDLPRFLARLKSKLDDFLKLYGIQGSLASIPVRVEQLIFVKSPEMSDRKEGAGLSAGPLASVGDSQRKKAG